MNNKKAVSSLFTFRALHDPWIIFVTATLTREQRRGDVKATML